MTALYRVELRDEERNEATAWVVAPNKTTARRLAVDEVMTYEAEPWPGEWRSVKADLMYDVTFPLRDEAALHGDRCVLVIAAGWE